MGEATSYLMIHYGAGYFGFRGVGLMVSQQVRMLIHIASLTFPAYVD